jgi:hypothetical protein
MDDIEDVSDAVADEGCKAAAQGMESRAATKAPK